MSRDGARWRTMAGAGVVRMDDGERAAGRPGARVRPPHPPPRPVRSLLHTPPVPKLALKTSVGRVNENLCLSYADVCLPATEGGR